MPDESDLILIKSHYPNCPDNLAEAISNYAFGLGPAMSAMAIACREMSYTTPEQLQSLVGFKFNPDPDCARGNAAYIASMLAHYRK